MEYSSDKPLDLSLEKDFNSALTSYKSYVSFLTELQKRVPNNADKELVQCKKDILKEAYIYEELVVPALVLGLNDVKTIFNKSINLEEAEKYIIQMKQQISAAEKHMHQLNELHKEVDQELVSIGIEIGRTETAVKEHMEEFKEHEKELEEQLEESKAEQEYLHTHEKELASQGYDKEDVKEMEEELKEEIEEEKQEIKEMLSKIEDEKKAIEFITKQISPIFKSHATQLVAIHASITKLDMELHQIVELQNKSPQEFKRRAKVFCTMVVNSTEKIHSSAGGLIQFFDEAKKNIIQLSKENQIQLTNEDRKKYSVK